MEVKINIKIIEIKEMNKKRKNILKEIDEVINMIMEEKNWGLRKSRNEKRINRRFKRIDKIKVKIIRVKLRRVIRKKNKKE